MITVEFDFQGNQWILSEWKYELISSFAVFTLFLFLLFQTTLN